MLSSSFTMSPARSAYQHGASRHARERLRRASFIQVEGGGFSTKTMSAYDRLWQARACPHAAAAVSVAITEAAVQGAPPCCWKPRVLHVVSVTAKTISSCSFTLKGKFSACSSLACPARKRSCYKSGGARQSQHTQWHARNEQHKRQQMQKRAKVRVECACVQRAGRQAEEQAGSKKGKERQRGSSSSDSGSERGAGMVRRVCAQYMPQGTQACGG